MFLVAEQAVESRDGQKTKVIGFVVGTLAEGDVLTEESMDEHKPEVWCCQ